MPRPVIRVVLRYYTVEDTCINQRPQIELPGQVGWPFSIQSIRQQLVIDSY